MKSVRICNIYKILTLNYDEPSSYYVKYNNIFNNIEEENKEKKSISKLNKNKLLTSKSIDNIEILDDKYKSNKFYQCNKFINKCCIWLILQININTVKV